MISSKEFFLTWDFILFFQIQVGGRSVVCSDVQQNVVCIYIWNSFSSFFYTLRVLTIVLNFSSKWEVLSPRKRCGKTLYHSILKGQCHHDFVQLECNEGVGIN